MRVVGLGQWLYFVWHLPAVLLTLGAVALGTLMARSLWRDALPPRARQLRWNVLGWSAVFASVLSVAIWPYLAAAATLRVTADGTWHMTNYLGVPVAVIPPTEVRGLLAEDLGGLHVGAGRLTVHRADGRVVHTVRLSGEAFVQARHTLGYPDAMLRPVRGGVEIPAHVYTPTGPQPVTALAAR